MWDHLLVGITVADTDKIKTCRIHAFQILSIQDRQESSR